MNEVGTALARPTEQARGKSPVDKLRNGSGAVVIDLTETRGSMGVL